MKPHPNGAKLDGPWNHCRDQVRNPNSKSGVTEILQPSARWGLGITPHTSPWLERPISPYLRAIMVDLSSVKHTTLAKDIMNECDALYRAEFDYYGQLLC